VRGIVTIGSPYRFGAGSRVLTALGMVAKGLGLTGMFNGNPIVPLRFIGEHLRDRSAMWDSRHLPMPIRAWLPGSIERDLLDEYLSRAFDRASISTVLAIFRTRDEATLRSADGMVNYGVAFEMLDRPLLVIGGTHDMLAPPASVRPAYDLSRSSDKKYRAFPLGHIDLIVGKTAPTTVWPLIGDWLLARCES
jgi:polyhydroxyalkanoate synthase